ncbi:MAG: hypothetical protein SYC29_18275, partial [Planctomycetota bacterium]|nr:hypothetical protein [Planctomycetota bacterium]
HRHWQELLIVLKTIMVFSGRLSELPSINPGLCMERMMNRVMITLMTVLCVGVGVSVSSPQNREPESPRTHWEYARWVESPGVSVWVSASAESFATSLYDTYKKLGGTKSQGEFGEPSEKDEVLNQAGRLGWELCAVDTEGSTVYFFRRRIR